ncbi:MAG TPA: Na/Pi symporter [Candidatus Paceibacterota bacterium]|nr:Na/Pi symporter [Candidatus Paceibacterota bacterium]
MVLLTDGLKAFAGDALRRWLIRFAGTPAKAFASGVLVTAIVQSSSATSVTVIGFVSAGLLTFPQAVGVVLGAILGTTGTVLPFLSTQKQIDLRLAMEFADSISE